jgi:hypothetical protein
MDLRLIESMLQDLNKQPPVARAIGKGSLINFTYLFAKAGHPLSPMVLVTDITPMYIRGVNLQYLTPLYIQKLLDQRQLNGCNNPKFSYFNIKGDPVLVGGRGGQKGAFRMYKRQGITNLKQFDCSFLSSLIKVMKRIDINEIYQMQKQVNEQIARATNPVAAATIQQGL